MTGQDLYKAAFIDRDGVINIDNGYTYRVEDLSIYDDVYHGLKQIQRQGFKIFIITNQSGIARGFYTINQFKFFMDFLLKNLNNNGVYIHDYFFCPHHEDGVIKQFSIKCNCRKPNPGLINQALDKYNIDLNSSILIGDKNSDIEAGLKANIGLNIKINRNKENQAPTKASHYNVINIIEAAELVQKYFKSHAK